MLSETLAMILFSNKCAHSTKPGVIHTILGALVGLLGLRVAPPRDIKTIDPRRDEGIFNTVTP